MLRFSINPRTNMSVWDLRIALFNYILSKQLNEDLTIKIEDINQGKNSKENEIFELLNLFSIDYKKIVYQSSNLKYYQQLATQLLSQKKAFLCFCGDEKLEELRQKAKKEGKIFKYDDFCENLSDELVLNTNAPFSIRIKKPNKNIEFKDILKKDLDYKNRKIDSFIILNKKKIPSYDYACAVDDMLMNISFIIKNENELSNTPMQIHIRKSLNYNKEIKYAHLPTTLNEEINKTDNENSVKWLIQEGFLPSAIANYLVLLGNKTKNEIFTIEDAILWFKLENISKNRVKFDIDKLKYINKKHLETIDELRLSKILGFADKDIGKLGKLFLSDSSTIKEIKYKVDLIFKEKVPLKEFKQEFNIIKQSLEKAPFIDNYEELKEYIKKTTNLEDKAFFKPLRYILTGRNNGVDISQIYPFIKNYIGEIIK